MEKLRFQNPRFVQELQPEHRLVRFFEYNAYL